MRRGGGGYPVPCLPTRAIFGRATAPASHWLYVAAATGEKAVEKLVDPDLTGARAVLVDFRRGGERGAQTVFPPSVHESGESIAWVCDEAPPEVDPEDLLLRVRRLAACAIFTRCWPAEGNRHAKALLLGGVFSRAGIPLPQAELMAQSIARAAGNPEWRDRVKAMEARPGANLAGYPALAEWVGDKRARVVAEWLGYPDTATVGGPEFRTWQSDAAGSTTEEPRPRGRRPPSRTRPSLRSRSGSPGGMLTTCVSSRPGGSGFHLARDLLDLPTIPSRRIRPVPASSAVTSAERSAKPYSAKLRLASAKTVAAVATLARADRRIAATVDQWDAILAAQHAGRDGGPSDRPARPHRPRLHDEDHGGRAGRGLPALARLPRPGDRRRHASCKPSCSGCRLRAHRLDREHALAFAHGTGANGKSVLIGTVSGMLGDYHRTAPIETFTARTATGTPPTSPMLRGARLVTAIETEEGRRWAESEIKALTGGDKSRPASCGRTSSSSPRRSS